MPPAICTAALFESLRNQPAQDVVSFPFPPSRRYPCYRALVVDSGRAPDRVIAVAFDVVRDYSGSTFFDAWDFYGNLDNLTWGTSLAFSVYLPSTVLII